MKNPMKPIGNPNVSMKIQNLLSKTKLFNEKTNFTKLTSIKGDLAATPCAIESLSPLSKL